MINCQILGSPDSDTVYLLRIGVKMVPRYLDLNTLSNGFPQHLIIGLLDCCFTSLHIVTCFSAKEPVKFCCLTFLRVFALCIVTPLAEEQGRSQTSHLSMDIHTIAHFVVSYQLRMYVVPRLKGVIVTAVTFPPDFILPCHNWPTMCHYEVHFKLVFPFTAGSVNLNPVF